MCHFHRIIAVWASLSLLLPLGAQGKETPISVRDSFRIGSTGVLCTAQNAPADRRLGGMFDRAYLIVCKDAARPIGSMLAIRGGEAGEMTTLDGKALNCQAAETASIASQDGIRKWNCFDEVSRLDYRRYAISEGDTLYVTQGLTGYDSALQLAMASFLSDQSVEGTVTAATTSVTDPAAFARIQAGALDPAGARAEAYARSNGGAFAQASEFFETLASRQADAAGRSGEFVANQGLQQSNLGNFRAAELLFDKASEASAESDGSTQRLIRNFRAINYLNQQQPDNALQVLADEMIEMREGVQDPLLLTGEITEELAQRINRENDDLKRLGGLDTGLTAYERALILDGQAMQLRGVAYRQQGKFDEARLALETAAEQISGVRDGRVTTTGWMLSEIQSELALVAEASGDIDEADGHLQRMVQILETEYPQTPLLLASKARRAGFLTRRNRLDEARSIYRDVIEQSRTIEDSSASIRELLEPYFALLAQRTDVDAAGELFSASQILQRPGVAQTQAILARELSEGTDEASALFRLAVTRTREIVRTQGDIARLSDIETPSADEIEQLEQLQDALRSLQTEQVALQSQLGKYPRYNVLAPGDVTLAEMQSLLRAGEAYYKLSVVGDSIYASFVTTDDAKSYAVPVTDTELSKMVSDLRDSIVRLEFGVPVTYPFDAELARQLYLTLFEPFDDELEQVRHLVFEPDGAMLQLPPYLLIKSQKGLDDYLKRTEAIDADVFDFTGIDWLGRGREVSIAVSPRSFADVRTIAPSSATRTYLGLGQNAVPEPHKTLAVADECSWPLATWTNPISSSELYLARNIVGPSRSAVFVEQDFADTNLLGQSDLNDYRILHFATHGLVTAPSPSCPARPALVTSFGSKNSDGLLTFKEVFDLKLDADVVILSACDTAGMATVAASREAGITTGGNYALDGLVRAFVGAGARSVVASHWPVPDDFNATKRLIGGLFRSVPGTPIGKALTDAQQGLMDDPLTSHPYYWSAFVVLGDAKKPLFHTGN